MKKRLRDMGEARIAIEDALGGNAPEETSPAALPAAAWRRALPWATVAGVLGVALLASLLMWAPWRTPPAPSPPTPRKLLTSLGADASLTADTGTAILSPDGTTLAFDGVQAGQRRLFVRRLDQLQAIALAGTDGAGAPFFSPDGQWIGFFAGGKLKKVSITGGAAVNLCDAPNGRGGAWTHDDTIIFALTGSGGLMRVPAAGGTPSVFGTLGEGAVRQSWPQALPDRKGVLYTEGSATAGWDSANLLIAPLGGGAPTVVLRGGYYGRYVSSGHLTYMQQGTLFAAPFDLSRLETSGQAVPALEGIAVMSVIGYARLAISSEGTLVHVPGGASNNPIDWMTRDGQTSPLRAAKAEWANPRFSPDGRKLALDISDGGQRDIWVYEWGLDTLTQLTFDPGNDSVPVWTPDGRRIVFASDRAKPGTRNMYWVNADGSGEVTRLTDSPEDHGARSWHPDGKSLAFTANRDLMILPMEGDAGRDLLPGKPRVFLSTPAVEVNPMFSPDGRWIAYRSNETGGYEIYVRPSTGPGGPWRISTEGGTHPHWSATARELLFVRQGKVMFAPYAVVGDSFRAEKPRLWSPSSVRDLATQYPYDIHPDGKRLAIVGAAEASEGVAQDKVVFFFNFGEYLKKIAPVTKP